MGEIQRSVLVVDDDPEIRDALCATLEDEGYQAFTACNGLEALELLIQMKPLPGLVLLDWRMPVMDGEHTLAALKSDAEFGSIPVIIISAARQHHVKLANMALPKPINMERLLLAVETWCS